MKLIIAMLFGGILLFSCAPIVFIANNKIPSDIPLMPFCKDDRFGYINSETFEIVISDQYIKTGNFIGDFAIVEKREGKPFIINKNNTKILGGFNTAVLFNDEDNKTVFALTMNVSSYEWNVYTADMWGGSHGRFDPSTLNYRLYNLTTGKLVIKLGNSKATHIAEYRPRIYFLNNYVIWVYNRTSSSYNEAVYEIQNNGSFKRRAITCNELISQIALERGLQYNERSYCFNNEYKYDSWIGYFNPLDIDKLLEQVPDNMTIENEYESFYNKQTFNIFLMGNITYPLKDNFLYEVNLDLKERRANERRNQYTGLYNATENIWVIPPMENKTFEKYYFTAEKDWIAHGQVNYIYHYSFIDFFNITTRKKYKNQYVLYNNAMTYYGHSERAWTKKPVIEDF